MQRISEVDHLRTTELRLHSLFLQGLAGDAVAYRRFLQATATHLRAFLRRRLNRWPDEVEDLVQEALLAIHNQRLSYNTGVPLTAWMYSIARYKLIDWLRRHARSDKLHDSIDDIHEDESALFSNADETSGDARRDLEKILAMLPDKQRDAIIYTKLQGLSVNEAATLLKMSDAAIKVSVHRGLKTLATILRETT
ncbi:MAG: sigma-70 family RNA polymerase sigma factor [Burkholderiaceae bacterium]|jgi:RNA polymerase sigma-70 factor (ECF subfamily)|nr:sigma-70 family RNA polymerase sigma factor [Burkholderiaceae bacterium]